jgi:sugar/nucleoside kinase (ribokinase family)
LERVHDGTASLIGELDVVVMAEAFPQALTGAPSLGAAMRTIALETQAALVCVTLGEDGCVAICNGEEVRVPAFRVQAVDTTGAGDLFRAGLIARWLVEPDQPDVGELLRYANAVAALNCRDVGAFSAAPRTEEVEALLRS